MDISEVSASGHSGSLSPLDLLGTINRDLPVGFVIFDVELRLRSVNRVAEAVLGFKESELVGRTVAEVSPEGNSFVEPILRRVLQGEIVEDWAFPANPEFLDESHRVVASPLADLRLWAGSFFPIESEQRVIGIGVVAVNRSNEHFSLNAISELREELELLSRTAEACAKARSVDELYVDICKIAVGVDDLVFAWIGQYRGGAIRSIAQYGTDNGYLHEAFITAIKDDVFAQGPTGQSLLSGNPYVVNDFASTPITKPWHDAAERAGFFASIAIPFIGEGEPHATITIYSRVKDRFSSQFVAKLTSMVSMATIAIERLKHRETELHLADILRMRDFALGSVSHAMIICDPRQHDCPITYSSPSFQTLTGYSEEEVVGLNCRFLQGPDTDPDTVRQIHDAIEEGRSCEVEILNYRKNGEPFWNSLSLFPFFNEEGVLTRYVGSQTDITERRRLEDKLMQSQKLEAIGTLAGGIAHDINNLLLVIQGYTSLILGATDDEQLRATADRIQSAVERGAQFTQRLLAYSRQQIHRPQVIQLSDAIHDSLQLMNSVLPAGVTVTTSFSDFLGPVRVDPAQINQIVFNLVNNSLDAMPDGGTIELRASAFELDPFSALRFEGRESGHYVLFEVIDNGHGMADETRSRIFEPFFTTKKSGTGLGLASVYGIVHQSGGHIEVESRPGAGTHFRLWFPQVDPVRELPKTKAPIVTDTKIEDIDVFGDETILIVENDEEALSLLVSALRTHGFVVLHANGGLEALEVSRNYNAKIDLLLTDVIMPGLNGRETAEQILKERPKVKVIFTSGYPSDLLKRKEFIDENLEFIAKPYQTAHVARMIRDLLDRATLFD